MTHGEETGSETHQDSAVLTYLEGLLMHRVAGGQGATATHRGEAGHSNQDQDNKATAGVNRPNHGSQHGQDKAAPQGGGATQHLRKARLLRSEAWAEQESQRTSTPPAELNRPNDNCHAGLNGSPQCKSESTLLASLLQSFSSRLQNVALSQQIVHSLRQQDSSSQMSRAPQEDKATSPCHGPAPSHLKGLMSKSKPQNHGSSVPYHRKQASKERPAESPKKLQSFAQSSSSSESLSCAQRLKAVANLVNVRSSPAPSPKPSVACSQLALLLSSEAHLQQYSREQALKAQLSGQTASERLAAMATQTLDKRQNVVAGQPQTAPDVLSSLCGNNEMPPKTSPSSSGLSPSQTSGQDRASGLSRTARPFRERKPFERQGGRPSPNCSSLLLHLLNSHNMQQQINGKGHLRDDFSTFVRQSSPMFSDSEHSNPDSNLHKDSSDADSLRSTCSPIDLSLKSRANAPTPVPASSSPAQEKLSESWINKWKPEPHLEKVTTEPRELETNPDLKPHHNVTLLQLLLDHKNNEKVNKGLDNPDLQQSIIPKVTNASVGRQTLVTPGPRDDVRSLSPQCRLGKISPQLTFSHGRDISNSGSPYIVYSSPHAACMPLDLCKNKPLANENAVKEPAFSASKMLQNLAQCGQQDTSTSPLLKPSLPTTKWKTQELKVEHSETSLERQTTPLQRGSTPLLEETNMKAPNVPESSQNVSEIENLLEKRTVLQLLLGNSSQKERVGSKRKRDVDNSVCSDKQPDQSYGSFSLYGLSKDVSVKTEPIEEIPECDDGKEAKQCQSAVEGADRQSPHPLYQRSIKQEPLSLETIPREGLLSHLLKQLPGTFPPKTTDDSPKSFTKREPQEYQGPTIPKKRRFSMEQRDHPVLFKTGKVSDKFCSQKDSECSTSGTSEVHGAKEPSSPPTADSPPAKFPPNESPPSDSQGFNVLKQLLLSDNCLKELSQPRSTFSPVVHHSKFNGSATKQYCSGLLNFQQTQKLSNVPAGLPSNSSPESHWGVHMAQESPRSKPIPIKKDPKGSTRWVSNRDDKQDCEPDSPLLTKANPILYYMLQRSNAHLVREGRAHEDERRQRRVQVMADATSAADAGEPDHKQNSEQNSQDYNERLTCDPPRLNGSLKKS